MNLLEAFDEAISQLERSVCRVGVNDGIRAVVGVNLQFLQSFFGQAMMTNLVAGASERNSTSANATT